MAFEYAGYILRTVMRNPTQVTRMARAQPAMRRAMLKHAKENPTCAITGRKGIAVHHIVPVSVNPMLACAPSNFLSLSPKMHYAIGHCGTGWIDYNENIMETIEWIREGRIKTVRFEEIKQAA